jgi:predicted nucleotide-binding protein (sugar kinase/HSP70/actin superfamily)
MNSLRKVSFPQMGDYNVPVYYFLSHILSCEIMMPPAISNKTVELGNKYSPSFVCMPFKYTLGTFIECLDKQVDTFIQLGGGCRYGYYSELQEQILKDFHPITYINLVSEGHTDMKKIIQDFKKIDSKFSVLKSSYYVFITCKMVKYMDKIDHFIRKNIGFEKEKNAFLDVKEQMLHSFQSTKGYIHLFFTYLKYKRKFKKIPILKPKKNLKVGIIGELYTIMEPFANYDLEYSLAKYNIEIKRFTNATYLLFKKKKQVKKYLKKVSIYAKNRLGADALDNVGRMLYLCQENYDGVIHIKSSFCTPEIGVMPILRRISNDYHMPILFFSFDTNTSKVGIETRLEAFYDMLEMRKKHE